MLRQLVPAVQRPARRAGPAGPAPAVPAGLLATPAMPEHQEEYRRLMQEDLVARHRAGARPAGPRPTPSRLTEEELLAWTRALNSLRLVLGTFSTSRRTTRAGGRPDAEESLYHWLTYLQGRPSTPSPATPDSTVGPDWTLMDLHDALDFLRANHRSVLVTRKRNGDPQLSPVVHGVDDQGRVVISSREPAYKVRNLRRDPRASSARPQRRLLRTVGAGGRHRRADLAARGHGAARRPVPPDRRASTPTGTTTGPPWYATSG